MLTNNSVAPDFSLADLDGNLLSLKEILGDGQNVLLVFLRHLG